MNLFNGRDIPATLIQVCYAVAIGLLFTIIFYRGKSLWPCIITHSVCNCLSAFANTKDAPIWHGMAGGLFLCIVSIGYMIYIIICTQEGEK